MSSPPQQPPPHIQPVVSPRHPASAVVSSSGRFSHLQPTLKLIHSLVSEQNRAYDKLERLCVDFGHRMSGSDQLERVIDWLLATMREEQREQEQQRQGAGDEPPVTRLWTQQLLVPRWQRGHADGYILPPALQPQTPQPPQVAAASTSSASQSHTAQHGSHPHPLPSSLSSFESFMPAGCRPLHLLAIGLSRPTPPAGITAAVVMLSSFAHLDQVVAAEPDVLRGKIAFFNHPFTSYDETAPYRSKGAVRAEAHGAVAVLVRSVCPVSLSTPHTGNMADSAIPAACVTLEDAELLQRLTARHGEVQVHLFSSASSLPWRPSRNVVAELRGRERPEEVVVIGAHIDSWDVGQGAQDDGQGVMVAWETLRLLSSSPALRPRRTVRLVLFTDEENRASGARAYLQQTREEVQAGRVVAAIETDVGCWDAIGFGFTGTPEAKALLAELAAPLRDWGWDSVCDDGEGVDIRPLIEQGVPGLLLRLEESWWKSDYFWYHHTEADTIDKVDAAKLTANTQLFACMAWLLAEADVTLPRAEPKAESSPPAVNHAEPLSPPTATPSSSPLHYLVKISPSQPLYWEMVDSEIAIVDRHYRQWGEALAAGSALFFGPVADSQGPYLCGVVRMGSEAEMQAFVAKEGSDNDLTFCLMPHVVTSPLLRMSDELADLEQQMPTRDKPAAATAAVTAAGGETEARQKRFLWQLTFPRPDFLSSLTAAEAALLQRHDACWAELMTAGVVLLFGTVQEAAASYVMALVQAKTGAEAAALGKADPLLHCGQPFKFSCLAMPRIRKAYNVSMQL